MKNLNEIVAPIIGPVLAKHVTAKSLELVVEVNEPGWASQVAMMEEQLLKTLNAALPLPISRIKIIVRRL